MATQMLLPENSISIVRGTSKTLKLTVKTSAGQIVDLTGGRLVFTVKYSTYDDLPLIQKLTTNPTEGSLTLPREGQAEFYLTPGDTNGLPVAQYVFDVWLITAADERYSVVDASSFVVTSGVTYLPT